MYNMRWIIKYKCFEQIPSSLRGWVGGWTKSQNYFPPAIKILASEEVMSSPILLTNLQYFSAALCAASSMASLLFFVRYLLRHSAVKSAQLKLCLATTLAFFTACILLCIVVSLRMTGAYDDGAPSSLQCLRSFAGTACLVGVCFNTLTAIYRYERLSGAPPSSNLLSVTKMVKQATAVFCFVTMVIVFPSWLRNAQSWLLNVQTAFSMAYGVWTSVIDYCFTILMIQMTISRQIKGGVGGGGRLPVVSPPLAMPPQVNELALQLQSLCGDVGVPIPIVGDMNNSNNNTKSKTCHLSPQPQPPPQLTIPKSNVIASLKPSSSNESANIHNNKLKFRLITLFSLMLNIDAIVLAATILAYVFTMEVDVELFAINSCLTTIHSFVGLSLLQMFKSGLRVTRKHPTLNNRRGFFLAFFPLRKVAASNEMVVESGQMSIVTSLSDVNIGEQSQGQIEVLKQAAVGSQYDFTDEEDVEDVYLDF